MDGKSMVGGWAQVSREKKRESSIRLRRAEWQERA
jgi:hypothetical protein